MQFTGIINVIAVFLTLAIAHPVANTPTEEIATTEEVKKPGADYLICNNC